MKTPEGNGKEQLLKTNMFSVWLTVPSGSVSGIEEDLKGEILGSQVSIQCQDNYNADH